MDEIKSIAERIGAENTMAAMWLVVHGFYMSDDDDGNPVFWSQSFVGGFFLRVDPPRADGMCGWVCMPYRNDLPVRPCCGHGSHPRFAIEMSKAMLEERAVNEIRSFFKFINAEENEK